MENSLLIVAALSFFIALSPLLSKTFMIPVVVIEIALGIAGRHFGLFEKNEYFFIIAKVGFLFLMFLAKVSAKTKKNIESGTM